MHLISFTSRSCEGNNRKLSNVLSHLLKNFYVPAALYNQNYQRNEIRYYNLMLKTLLWYVLYCILLCFVRSYLALSRIFAEPDIIGHVWVTGYLHHLVHWNCTRERCKVTSFTRQDIDRVVKFMPKFMKIQENSNQTNS